ncbi:MAG: SRPBCC family protein, partial [Gemmatimonadota bacterium]
MSTTTNTRSASGRIELDASPERVWKALTDAADLVRWFPLEARVEPGEGGSVHMSWKNEYAGTSEILTWEPNERLAISWS